MKYIKALGKPALRGLILWLIIFIVSEIIISGGRHPASPYLVALNAIILIAFFWYQRDYFIGTWLSKAKKAIVVLIVFALLDFLVINFLLYQNNYYIYSTYQTYTYYGLIILLSLVINEITNLITNKIARLKK